MKYLLILTLVIFTVGCSIEPVKLSNSECDQLNSYEEKYGCYLLELRYIVNSQIEDNLRNWLEIYNPYRGRLIAQPKVGMELSENGEIHKLELLHTSGDATFDNMLLKSIKYAGPFKLPKNDQLRKRLLKFTWAIQS